MTRTSPIWKKSSHSLHSDQNIAWHDAKAWQLLQKSASRINTWKKYKSRELIQEKIAAKEKHQYISFFDHIIHEGTDLDSIVFTCDHHFNNLGCALLNDLLRKRG